MTSTGGNCAGPGKGGRDRFGSGSGGGGTTGGSSSCAVGKKYCNGSGYGSSRFRTASGNRLSRRFRGFAYASGNLASNGRGARFSGPCISGVNDLSSSI